MIDSSTWSHLPWRTAQNFEVCWGHLCFRVLSMKPRRYFEAFPNFVLHRSKLPEQIQCHLGKPHVFSLANCIWQAKANRVYSRYCRLELDSQLPLTYNLFPVKFHVRNLNSGNRNWPDEFLVGKYDGFRIRSYLCFWISKTLFRRLGLGTGRNLIPSPESMELWMPLTLYIWIISLWWSVRNLLF